jgi:hypothetical protein
MSRAPPVPAHPVNVDTVPWRVRLDFEQRRLTEVDAHLGRKALDLRIPVIVDIPLFPGVPLLAVLGDVAGVAHAFLAAAAWEGACTTTWLPEPTTMPPSIRRLVKIHRALTIVFFTGPS